MNDATIQIIAAFLGSIGFAVFFRMRGRQILAAGLGGLLTWTLYLLFEGQLGGDFVPNMLAAVFAGIYAEIMARVNKAPATIFLTASAVPLIPGGRLYYTMAGLVAEDHSAFMENGEVAVTIALAISLGFVIVALGNKYINILKKQVS